MTPQQQNTLLIHEIFFSIQGESTYAGRPCVFIRLTSCDLRCTWCDTAYAFEEGSEMEIQTILQKVKTFHCSLVEVTGGEPLAQANVHELMKQLCDENYEVLIETGGHRDIRTIDSRVKRIMDIKCPGSAMEKRNRWQNIEALNSRDEVKFVIADRADYEWAKQILHTYRPQDRCRVILSPVFGKLENLALAEWILQDQLDVIFQIQLHKYIWNPTARGV